jgi:hypothetical protein
MEYIYIYIYIYIQTHNYSFHITNLYLNMIPHFLYFPFMYSNTISHSLLSLYIQHIFFYFSFHQSIYLFIFH